MLAVGDGTTGRAESAKDGDGIPPWHSYHTNPCGKFEKNSESRLAFVPARLPPRIKPDGSLVGPLIEAERGVAELKGIRTHLPRTGMLIRACLKREAVLSSRIEGTTATLGDLNRHEAIGGVLNPASDDRRLQEVINHVEALSAALKGMQSGGCRLDLDLIRQAHRTLMHNVRGGNMEPGQFRAVQNYIVQYSGKGRQIQYVPPPHESVPSLLEDVVEFVRTTPDQKMSGLVQCALAHYQFEAVHPFLDGNGRVGRLLIPLVLYFKDVLPEPLLCLSAYFEKHRDEYYARLQGVSRKGEWREWVRFFLEGVASQAAESIATIKELEEIRAKYDKMLAEKRAGANARLLVPSLLANPYTTVPRACGELGRTYPAAKRAIDELVEAGILRQVEVRYRGKVFHAEDIDKVLGGD